MFVLDHLGLMWAILFQDTAYNIAVMIGDEGMDLIHRMRGDACGMVV
jgi:hypothetical protein